MKIIILIVAVMMIHHVGFSQSDSVAARSKSNTPTKADEINQQKDMDHKRDHQMHQKSDPALTPQPVDKTKVDGYRMENGKLMLSREGRLTPVEKEQTFSDGSRLMGDGTIIRKDGTKLVIRDDEYVTLSGNVVKSNRNKDMYLVPDSTKK